MSGRKRIGLNDMIRSSIIVQNHRYGSSNHLS